MGDSPRHLTEPFRDVSEPARDAAAPFAVILVMLAVPAIVAAAWLLLPDTPVGLAVLGVIALAAVGIAIWRVLSMRRLSEQPGRHPVPPPAAR